MRPEFSSATQFFHHLFIETAFMAYTNADLASRLDFALAVYAEARQLIMSFYQHSSLEVEEKTDFSPVTEADRGAEKLIRERLDVAFPEDGVLGEEFPEKPGQSAFRWILDPVDGTKSFVHGVPLFGTLIGLEVIEGEHRHCVMGVCGFPALNEVVYASEGNGAYWKIGDQPPRRVHVSQVSTIEECTFLTTNMQRWQKIGKWEAYTEILERCKLSRGWGDCYGHVLVATGRADLMVDPALNPWDAAALVPILQEAGGHFVDWKGVPTIYGKNGISVTGKLKDEVLQILNKS
ncbi:Histidinol-phosphatase [Planctopirus ephydatiae]|uniref:Histidinol-phosphatase n=2 Tax=Planctopirus ephydatiae TaxID=2528019 RepID=A0A518GRB8_9PLAN|nr:Histidinol-phosphatase [Planctopirus ephydatiae]